MAGTQPIVAGVQGRYATALFEQARDDGKLEQVERELEDFVALLDDSHDLDRVLKSPAHGHAEKRHILAKVLQKAGIKGISASFLSLVAKNNRLGILREIVDAFKALSAAHRGEIKALVISAGKLSDRQQDAIAEKLKSTLGKDVMIDSFVDPDLLGGLVVKVGSRMIDNSLRTKLNNLRVAMKEVN